MIETNLEEIDAAGEFSYTLSELIQPLDCAVLISMFVVRQASQARKQSFSAANPLALGGVGGGVGPRSAGLQTPLNWLSGKLGVAR